jgi:hypothetical protein
MEQNQMTKFCIELEGMMLPDAIAAVVEAWYDAQNTQAVKKNCGQSISDPRLLEGELNQKIGLSNEIIKDKQSKSKLKLSMYIEQRGGKLAIRGRFPSKANAETPWVVQRISIGVAASPSNVKKAEILACLLIDQLKRGDFSWGKWSDKDYIKSACANIGTILHPQPLASVF